METQHIGNLIHQQISQVKATHLPTPYLSGDVEKFELALSSQLVKDTPLEELKQVLRKIIMKLGIREQNLPNDLAKAVLIEHIYENYGGHRLNEIPLAFDMAIRGGLCDSDGEVVDPNCFESFSCIYVSKIMNAYRFWSESEYRTLPTRKPEHQKIFTQEELDDYAREDAEWTYQMFLKQLPLTYPESNDKILRQDGLLKDGELVMEFFLRKATSGAEHIYTRMNNNY